MANVDLDAASVLHNEPGDTRPVSGEDVAIERAAIALCWDSRPALMARETMDRIGWWCSQTDGERRLCRRRARVAIEEWENAHA